MAGMWLLIQDGSQATIFLEKSADFFEKPNGQGHPVTVWLWFWCFDCPLDTGIAGLQECSHMCHGQYQKAGAEEPRKNVNK